MRVPKLLAAAMGAAVRRPLLVAAAVVLLGAAGALAALGLRPETTTDTLVSRSTPEYKASEHFHERFGDDAVYVLVQEKLTDLVLSPDILRPLGLEGCLSGSLPRDSKGRLRGGAKGPCAKLAQTRP